MLTDQNPKLSHTAGPLVPNVPGQLNFITLSCDALARWLQRCFRTPISQ